MDMASRGDGELDELKMQLLQGVKAVTDLQNSRKGTINKQQSTLSDDQNIGNSQIMMDQMSPNDMMNNPYDDMQQDQSFWTGQRVKKVSPEHFMTRQPSQNYGELDEDQLLSEQKMRIRRQTTQEISSPTTVNRNKDYNEFKNTASDRKRYGAQGQSAKSYYSKIGQMGERVGDFQTADRKSNEPKQVPVFAQQQQ